MAKKTTPQASKKLCKCSECKNGINPTNFMVMCTVRKIMTHSVVNCLQYEKKPAKF